MAAVGMNNYNRYGFFALDSPPSYDSTQVLSQDGRGAPQNPALASAKFQQNGYASQPPYNPPRFQNRVAQQGFCGPPPRPSSSCVNDPCLTTPNDSYLNMQLKQQVYMALQSHPPTRPMIPPQTPQNLPSAPAQHSVAQGQLPRTPEAISRPPIGPPGGPNVALPTPPGLPVPNGRGTQHNNRPHIWTKPGEPCLNQSAEKSDCGGLVIESRPVFPASLTATPRAVKLPINQDIPPSPASTVCSLPEDPSGFSSVPSSDTTFTSVGSNASNMPSQTHKMSRDICLNWMKGYPCYRTPCKFRHPERPNRPTNSMTQPTQPPSAPPHAVVVVKPSAAVCKPNGNPNSNSIPREQCPLPPSTIIQPPLAPSRADVAKPPIAVRVPNNNSVPQKQDPPPPRVKIQPSIASPCVDATEPSVLVRTPNNNSVQPPSTISQPPLAPPRAHTAEPSVVVPAPNNNSAQDPPPPSASTRPPLAPPGVDVAKTSVAVRVPNNNSVPRKQGPSPPTQPPLAPPRVDAAKPSVVRTPSNSSVKDPPPPSARTQPPLAPPGVDVARASVAVRAPNNNSVPRKQGPPPSAKTQPPMAPSRVGVAKPSDTVREPNHSSIPRKQVPPPNGDVELQQRPEPPYSTTIADHIKVRFDRGFEVRDVMTGFESRWVHLGNISSSVTSAALNELLGPYKVDTVNMPESSSGKPMTVKVQFASVADAMKAVTDLNGTKFAKRTILAKLSINNSLRGSTILADTDVQLAWECPSRVGYAGYDTLKEAKAAIDSLNGFPLEYVVVSAQLYEGLPCVGAYNVIFKELPATTTELDLRKFANSKAVMLGRPNYESLDKAVRSIRSRLEEYGTITAFDIIPPPFRDGIVKAWVHFTSPAEARAAQDDLDRRRPKAIGHTIFSCRHVVSLSHVLSSSSYKKMREDIGWLRWSWQRRYGPSVAIRERFKETGDDDAPAYIKLSSEHPELLSNLKYEFEQLLHGETVTLEKKPLWDNFLITDAGRTYVAQLQDQYPGVQIQVQCTRRVISLWGPIVMRHRARKDIVCKLVELKAQQYWKIPLTGKLMGIFCSAELATLQELLGSENCIPDFGERVLVVRGNDLAFRTACKAVQDAQSRQGDVASSSTVTCPVCFGEAVVPVTLACGHRWCRTCLTGYLTSAVENRMFPLRCLGNDATCTQCIPLGLSRKLLSAADFDAVIEAAFWVYVHRRPDEFHNCPTPDCTQVYRSAPPNSVLQCPSCLIRICPACHIEYHDGMTCEERDVAEDKLFNEWSSNHDVKSCPGCKAPIERSEGCNHVTCTRCQTHICWECLATFPRGQGIYDHMRIQHGGIGL